MFNALNRFMSRLDGEQPTQQSREGSFGFQVLRNTNLELQIEPWFDFVIGINGRPIDNPNTSLFAQEVRNCAGGTVSLALWSAKGQRTREMHIPVPVNTAFLGVSLQWTDLAVAANIWHVLDVAPNSPADLAGLLPYSDYILGSPEGALQGEGGLSEMVDDFTGRPLRLYVYNNEYDVTREVTIQPSREWGGEGALGCVLGYGALHRLPAPLNEPVSAPGETMFDGEQPDSSAAPGGAGAESVPPSGADAGSFVPAAPAGGDGAIPGAEMLVPAQMVGAPPVSAPAGRGKKKDKHGHSPNKALMDDYFKEEEQKSRELDGPGEKAKGNVTPPPKAGGPPRAASTEPPKE